MYEGVDSTVLNEELAYEDLLPLSWQIAEPTQDLRAEAMAFAARNIRVLQASIALEDQPTIDKPVEKEGASGYAADIQRLDMKMNLLLALMGKMLATKESRPNAVKIRFNSHGASWSLSTPEPSQDANAKNEVRIDQQGILKIYLRDCLLEPLCLFATITNIVDGIVHAKIPYIGDAEADLIERLTFQRHRKQIADARQLRAGDALGILKPQR